MENNFSNFTFLGDKENRTTVEKEILVNLNPGRVSDKGLSITGTLRVM